MGEQSETPLFAKCCIIGLGLMGGSLGMALGRHGVVEERWGYDHREDVMEEARNRDAVDRTGELPAALEAADLVVLALPVRQASEMIRQIAPLLKSGTMVTDLGSTKKTILDAMSRWLPRGIVAVGGHPMTGSEKAGIRAADPLLLENAVYLLTPAAGTSRQAVATMEKMVRAIKAYPVVLEAEEHDQLVALVSHLPHLLAVALVNTVRHAEGEQELIRVMAGGGFRDTTRIALGDTSVWYDIFSTNSHHLKESLQRFQEELKALWLLLEKKEEEAARMALDEAKAFRSAVPYRGKGVLPEIFQLVLVLPDVPGIIGKVATLVGDAGLNISEVEVLKNREEDGGSIRLGFSLLEERDQALLVLESQGFRCWKKG